MRTSFLKATDLFGQFNRRNKRTKLRLQLESLEPRVVLAGTPVISEFLTSNDRVLEDQDGDDSDWIEVLNPTSEVISLKKWSLTDDANDLTKWRFPEIELGPGEQIIVFASGKDRDNPNAELHTNFRLSSDGEYLGLVEPNGQTVVSEYGPVYPLQIQDVSYGISTGVVASRPIQDGNPIKYLIPSDNTLDPTEPDSIGGTWLDPEFDDGAWSDATSGIGYVPPDQPVTLADSVADFSGIQGQDNWQYGAWAKNIDTNKIYSVNEFTPMNAAAFFRPDTNKWDQGVNGPPNLEISADGAHPSTVGFLQQWAIRRWVSETEGEITISGNINNMDATGDGVVARVLQNGQVLYETALNGTQEAYSVTAQVQLGDAIDFALDAGAADDETGDATVFTSIITGLAFNPAPEVVVADSVEDWVKEVQGAGGWTYGYYDKSADADNTYQVENFLQFPDEFWSRTRWQWPARPPETEIGSTAMEPSGVDGGPIHWAIRRWTSDRDGPTVLNWTIDKTRTGGDGVTGRVFRNGQQVDSITVGGNDSEALTRTVEFDDLKTGDLVDIVLDPLGVGADPAAPDGDDDRTNLTAQFIRKADLAFDISTDIRDAMLGSGSVYTRIPFQVPNTSSVSELRLRMKYDAGFAAYINGKPVADSNAPAEVSFDSLATTGRNAVDATNFEVYDLTSGIEFLVSGTNVLQVHGMNDAADSDNFLLLPELEIGVQTVDVAQKRYFVSPSAGQQNGFGVTRLGPFITNMDHTPNQPLAEEPIVVTANVTRTFADISKVSLNYRVMFGATTEMPMIDDGSGADVAAGDGVFSAVIPANIAEKGQMVRWFVTATAVDGVNSRGPSFLDPTNDEEYRGTVIRNPELQSNLPIFHWFIERPRDATRETGGKGSFFYDGEFYDNVQADLHGQSSKGFPAGGDRGRPLETAKSYDVDFPNSHRFRLNDDVRRMDDFNLMTNYADQSLIRNTLAWEQHKFIGAPYLITFPVRVQQNGEFFAIYEFMEDADERWLDRVGLDANGSLYKMYTTFTAGGNEKKTRTDEDSQDLRDIIDGIGTRNADRIEYLYDNVDIPAMVNFVVGFPLVSETDCCHKNYYAYRDTEGTGEWSFYHWDEDLTQGRHWTGNYFDDRIYHERGGIQIGGNNTLLSLLYAQPGFRDMWLQRLRTVFDSYYTTPGTPYEDRPFETRVDELYEQMKDDAALHNERNPTNWGRDGFRDFKVSVDLLKKYMADRRQWFYTTQVAADDTAVVRIFQEEEGQTPASYFIPTDNSLGTSWVAPDFNDDQWKPGFNAIGFERNASGDYDEIFQTNVDQDMGAGTAVYLRVPFTVDNLAEIQKLTLRMKFDDGFVAYLNGQEIARDNAPDDQQFDSRATRSHSDRLAREFENFVVTEHLDKLRQGTNLLAIHALNRGGNDTDFLMLPELVSGEIFGGQGIVPAPQVGNPKIEFGKIEFQPASRNQEEEYIEIVNNNSVAVDMSGWGMSGDANVTFKAGTVLPSGWTMYVTPNAKAFRARAEGPSGGQRLFVYGNYDGRLPNSEGNLELHAADGELISAISYVGETSQVAEFLRVTELNYNPLGVSSAERAADVTLDSEDFEFVEVMNVSPTETINLDGVRFTQGILFDFTNSAVQTLAPGERAVVVKDQAGFEIRYGVVDNVAGTFDPGSGLANDSDQILLVDSSNSEISQFRISANGDRGWPERADGSGSSLQVIDVGGDYNDPANWRASTQIHGTPGSDAVAPITRLVINEVLSNTAGAGMLDSIELHNTSGQSIALSNFYLSDSAANLDALAKFAITEGNVDANGYVVFNEQQFNVGDNGFGLSGTRGDDVYLTTGDGKPTQFVDDVHFPAAAAGESFGRIDGGWFVPLTEVTLGGANSAVRVGPLVISEIQYNPGTPSPAALERFADLDSNDLEFVEIYNPTTSPVELTNWRIRGGVDINFDDQLTIDANQTIVVLSFNPARADNVQRVAAFRAQYGIDQDVRLVGGFGNQLDNGGERVTLQRPGQPPAADPAFIPRLLEDEVIFSDGGAWPMAADGTGSSLQRISPNTIGLDPSSWIAASPTPGVPSSVSADLDGNGVVDAADIQVVCSGLHNADTNVDFDGSGTLTTDDLLFYVNNLIGTSVGDANLDGIFNSSDLVVIFQAGEYEDGTAGNSTWAEGDWTCDGEFDSSDLVFAFINGSFSTAAVADSLGDRSQVAASLDKAAPIADAGGLDVPPIVEFDLQVDRPLFLEGANVDRIFEAERSDETPQHAIDEFDNLLFND